MAVQKTHRLVRLKQGERSVPIRTQEIEGTFFEQPVAGRGFVFFAEPLTNKDADFRLISTSRVAYVAVGIRLDEMTFETESGSLYRIEPIRKEA